MPWGQGRPADQNRMLAEINGERTYRGTPHGCGTNERYTNGGACVFCARRVQREQRQARIQEMLAAEQRTVPESQQGDPWD